MMKNLYIRNQVDEDTIEYLLNPEILNYLRRYFELDFGGKKVVAPYYINTKKRKDLRALVGKGTPEEMVLETRVWAQVKGIDLTNSTSKEIRDLMVSVGIGVDCSGMVLHALNDYSKNSSNGRLFGKIKHINNSIRARIARMLRPVENINANTLTSDTNCEIVTLNQVRPGDFLRGIGKQRNAYHIALVTRVVSDTTDNDGETIKEIEYVHSHRGYGDDNGVRYGKIININHSKPIQDQEWDDAHSDGINYILEMDIKPHPEDSGFRRLRLFN